MTEAEGKKAGLGGEDREAREAGEAHTGFVGDPQSGLALESGPCGRAMGMSDLGQDTSAVSEGHRGKVSSLTMHRSCVSNRQAL